VNVDQYCYSYVDVFMSAIPVNETYACPTSRFDCSIIVVSEVTIAHAKVTVLLYGTLAIVSCSRKPGLIPGPYMSYHKFSMNV
jgi:hypothetical protein